MDNFYVGNSCWHTKPLSRIQSLSESRGGGSKLTKPIFGNSTKRYLIASRIN